jgi:RNA polymerase sigma factor (sigma-70 family)
MADARRGDEHALSVLYSQYSKQMFGLCMKMLGRRDEAEDVLQEAFVIAFNKLRHLHKDDKFGGWLRRIVINECIRHSKRKIQWQELTAEEEMDFDEEEDWFLGIEPETVYKAIKQLPDGYRQVFNLFAVENLSHKAIAAMLGISESTSKSQYHKGRKYLKELLLKIKR